MPPKNLDNVENVPGQANKPMSRPAHCLRPDEVSQELSANLRDGLSGNEAESRLKEYGRNELDEGQGVQPLKILIRQVANAMMLVNMPWVLMIVLSS